VGDTFEKFVPGQRFNPSARTLNAWQDAARAVLRGGLDAGGLTQFKPETSTEVLVSNTTTAVVGEFAVLGVTGPLVTEAASHATFAESRSLVGALPQTGAPFVITSAPIGRGKIGRATMLGVTPARVYMRDPAHQYARPVTGDTTQLISDGSGPARILWVQPASGSGAGSGSGSGSGASPATWAIVELGGGPLQDETAELTCLSVTPVLGRYPAVRRIQVGMPAAWPFAEQCYIVPINNFVPAVGETYPGRRNVDQFAGRDVWAVRDCCSGVGSGSGSGVPSPGCCGFCLGGTNYGQNLCATFSAPGLPCLDGLQYTMQFNPNDPFSLYWGFGVNNLCNVPGYAFSMWVRCLNCGGLDVSSQFVLGIFDNQGLWGGSGALTGSPTTASCSPFSLVYSLTFQGHPVTLTVGAGNCSGGSGSGGGGGGGPGSPCCPAGLPTALVAHVAITTGSDPIDGHAIPIAYDPSGPWWVGTVTVAGNTYSVVFQCSGGQLSITFYAPDGQGGALAVNDCNTPQFSFTGVHVDYTLGTRATITIGAS
jgi:hypothetical protein